MKNNLALEGGCIYSQNMKIIEISSINLIIRNNSASKGSGGAFYLN